MKFIKFNDMTQAQQDMTIIVISMLVFTLIIVGAYSWETLVILLSGIACTAFVVWVYCISHKLQK